ncbi:MAG: CCA tRNA nucleotidyltransferase [Bdellovibrionales bacterium]
MSSRQSQRIQRRLETLHAHPQFATALEIVLRLQKRGFDAVMAGGCVRDGLLNRVPKDLDVATSAPPDDVEAEFAQTLAVGKAFGTIVVIEAGHNFEVTTFRREGGYADGRHPDRVEFTDMNEDAKRRDFTVNALFYDPVAEEVFDFVGGVKDLSAGLLRTVGLAEERFAEDHLRMLRAPRFVAQLGFTLDSAALAAVQKHHAAIAKVSTERVFNEMRSLLSSPHLEQGLKVLRESRLEADIWPEMAKANLDRLSNFGPFLSWENAFAAVMLLSSEEKSETLLRAWKAPRESMRHAQALMDGCKTIMNPTTTRAGRMRVLGSEEYAEILQLAEGFLPGNRQVIQGWIAEFLAVAGPSGKLPPPFLNGQDLIAAGIAPGAEMGELLKDLYEAQLEGEIKSREAALEEVAKIQ